MCTPNEAIHKINPLSAWFSKTKKQKLDGYWTRPKFFISLIRTHRNKTMKIFLGLIDLYNSFHLRSYQAKTNYFEPDPRFTNRYWNKLYLLWNFYLRKWGKIEKAGGRRSHQTWKRRAIKESLNRPRVPETNSYRP